MMKMGIFSQCYRIESEVLSFMKQKLAVFLLIVLAAIAVWQWINSQKETVGLEIGNKAPNFEVTTLDGEKKSLSDFYGKKVLLNFWATWCPPCKKEMPIMQKIYEKHQDEVTIVAVNFTASEKSAKDVENFVQQAGFTFPILLDPKNKMNSGYKILTYPTSFFLDENGVIQDKVVGELNEKTIKEKLNLK